MLPTDQLVRQCLSRSTSRVEFWIRFLDATQLTTLAEVGVFRGDFASALLKNCPEIQQYYMIDPWRHLADWNKPANRDDGTFDRFFAETLQKTEFAQDKRTILRGTTTEVIDTIADGELDFVYVDGDHTLRGITIDLVRAYGKVRSGGWIGGDDFSSTIWQHSASFEPTLVFPFAVYFAEAVGANLYALPYKQFLLEKQPQPSFQYRDLTGNYHDTGLRAQFSLRRLLKPKLTELLPWMPRLAKRLKGR